MDHIANSISSRVYVYIDDQKNKNEYEHLGAWESVDPQNYSWKSPIFVRHIYVRVKI